MKAITLEFKKYQSSGNDFVLIDEDRNHGITEDVRKALVHAAGRGDIEACNRAAFDLYRLTADERRSICENGL